MDETDQASVEFVREVCMISCADRGGYLDLKGTPDGNGILDYWLNKAKKKVEFRIAFERGEIQSVPDEMSDFMNWTFFESDAEKENVFTPRELVELKALIGEKLYRNQMLCQDVTANEKYYYKNEMDKVGKEGRKSVSLKPHPKVPIRNYYDVGIGNKSDRMAFVIAQHFPTHTAILYSWDAPNADYSDVADAVRKSPYAHLIYEHVLPHDMGVRQQSDKKFKWELFMDAMRTYGVTGLHRILMRPKDPGPISMWSGASSTPASSTPSTPIP